MDIAQSLSARLQDFILLAPGILIGLTFHEFAHAYVALRLGDPTAKYQGRLTLNPAAHIDPMGLIVMFIMRFGWAKPVPVDPRNLRDPKRDMLWISAAGPLMNMALAFVFGMIIRVFIATGWNMVPATSNLGVVYVMLNYALWINLALAVFNLIPFPPLDGSKILAGLLPNKYAGLIYRMEQKGPMVLFGVLLLGFITGIPFLGFLISPFVSTFFRLFAGV